MSLLSQHFIDSLAVYRILGFSSEVQRLHYLLDSDFAVEESKAILITVNLYMTWFFFLESYETPLCSKFSDV